MQWSALLFIFALDREPFLFEIRQAEGLVTLGCHMQHVDAFACLHPEICLVSHQKLDQLDISVEACEVERVEALVRPGWRVDPVGHILSHFCLYAVEGVLAQLVWMRQTKALHFDVFQVLRQSLLIVCYEELADAEGVIICGSVEQIMTIVVHHVL